MSTHTVVRRELRLESVEHSHPMLACAFSSDQAQQFSCDKLAKLKGIRCQLLDVVQKGTRGQCLDVARVFGTREGTSTSRRLFRSINVCNRGSKLFVTCILVQRHEAASQEGVMKYHLCSCVIQQYSRPLCFSCRYFVLLERRFSLVTISFAQSLSCGERSLGLFFCVFSPFLFQLQSLEVWCFRTSVELLSVLFGHSPRQCTCCMAQVTWMCGSYSLVVLCTFDRCLDTETRVLSTTQLRNRTSTEGDKLLSEQALSRLSLQEQVPSYCHLEITQKEWKGESSGFDNFAFKCPSWLSGLLGDAERCLERSANMESADHVGNAGGTRKDCSQ